MRTSLPLTLAVLTTLGGLAIGGCSEKTVDGAASRDGTGADSGTGAGTGGGDAGGGTTSGGTASGGAGGATSATGAGGSAPPTAVVTCQGKTYQCGDLIDNDEDGLLDAQDPDCLGPCDNTEDSYYGGIPGQAGPACTVDCYFDQDSGSGNDDCHWNHKCDPNEKPPGYHPESREGARCAYDEGASTPGAEGKSCSDLMESQSTTCHDTCGPLTPNGCDCFGCCELPAESGNYVWLGSDAEGTGKGSCSRRMEDIYDPNRCEPCTPVKACLNTCERCELCLGKTTLPDDCFPPSGGAGGSTGAGTSTGGAGGSTGAGTSTGGAGGSTGTGQCETGVQPCGLPGQDACPPGQYCITGCCQAIPH